VGSLVSLPQARKWKVGWPTLLVGLAGLFGYHFFYFSAFQHAPAVEANLINYLWPLLIVLLSPLILKGFKLHSRHLTAAVLGFIGTMLIITGGTPGLERVYLPGYLLAGAAAITWAVYSLLTRRLPHFSTAAVGGFCLVSGLLSIAVFGIRQGEFPYNAFRVLTPKDWFYLILVGIGPMGISFYTWDAALKRGDPRTIGALAYLTPLLSTLILIFVGGKVLTWVTMIAMCLIIAGAIIGTSVSSNSSTIKVKE
jgi:drug/metabolite transporter (DMT)-like permease